MKRANGEDYPVAYVHPCCPLCGQQVPSPQFVRFDNKNNMIIINGVGIKAQPLALKIIKLLYDAYPQMVSTDTLILKLYGKEGGPECSTSTVRVLIYNLRRNLAGSGLEILTPRRQSTYREGGYALRFSPPTIEAMA